MTYACTIRDAAALSVAPVSLPQFGAAVSDAELGFAVSRTSSVVRPVLMPGYQEGSVRITTAEQMDAWWAYDGAALIAEAVRPRPEIATGFNVPSLADGAVQLQFTTRLTAMTFST